MKRVEPDPRPVYIVAAPAPEQGIGVGTLVAIAIVIVGVLLIVSSNRAPVTPTSGQNRASSAAGIVAPADSGAALEAMPTPFNETLDHAIQAAMTRQQDRLNAKQRECDTLDGAAYDKCDAAWSKLDRQWDALDECTNELVDRAGSDVGDVAACERQVGIH